MAHIHTKNGISIGDLSKKYGVSPGLLYCLAKTGNLPGCRRIGHRFVVHHETFERWLMAGNGDESQHPTT